LATIRSIVDRRTPNAAASRSADRKQNLVLCGPGIRSSSKRRGSSPSNKACTSRGSPWKTWRPHRRHRADDTVAKAIRAILRAELIVVEDIGLLPVAPDAAEGLYRLVDAAYGPFRWPPTVRFQGRPWSDIRGP